MPHPDDQLVQNFQQSIIAAAESKLARRLTSQERRFVTSRGGLIALECVKDTVEFSSPAEVERYLNSEPHR